MAFKSSNLVDVSAQFASTLVGRGCFFGLQVFLARILGPGEFGLYAVGWTVAGLVGTLAPFGMPQAVLRYGVAGRGALTSRPIQVAAVVGLVLTVLVFVAAGPIARVFFSEPAATSAIMALAPSILLLGISGVLTSALRASDANVQSAAMTALVFVLYLAATMLGFAGEAGRTPAMAGHTYTLAILVTLVPTVWLLRRRPPADFLPTLRPLLKFGVITMLIHSASVMNLWADRVVVGMMLDARAVGIYQAASQLAMVGLVLRSAVASVFEARVPKGENGSTIVPDVTRDFVASTRILLHVSVPGLLWIAMTASFWTGTLFGRDYLAAATPLAVLIVGQLIQAFTGPSVTALHMTGEEHAAMYLTVGTCLLNLLGNVLLIPLFGLAGSAAASGIANSLLGATCLWRLMRSGRLRISGPAVNDILLAMVACGGGTALAVFWLGAHSFVGVGAALAIAYVVYGVVVAVFRRVEDEAFDLARGMVRRALGLRPSTPLPAP